MTTNAQRQAAYKERMRKAGYQQISPWIQPERKRLATEFVDALREAKEIDLKPFEAIVGILKYHVEK